MSGDIWSASVYALLGLIVGVLAGRALPPAVRKPAASARPKRERESESRRNGGDHPESTGGTGRGVELYVGNLPYDTGDKELVRAFERFGRVLSVRMIENRRNGKPKGFGFVEMDTDATADAAIKAMNGANFKGRALVVNEAKSRARRD